MTPFVRDYISSLLLKSLQPLVSSLRNRPERYGNERRDLGLTYMCKALSRRHGSTAFHILVARRTRWLFVRLPERCKNLSGSDNSQRAKDVGKVLTMIRLTAWVDKTDKQDISFRRFAMLSIEFFIDGTCVSRISANGRQVRRPVRLAESNATFC